MHWTNDKVLYSTSRLVGLKLNGAIYMVGKRAEISSHLEIQIVVSTVKVKTLHQIRTVCIMYTYSSKKWRVGSHMCYDKEIFYVSSTYVQYCSSVRTTEQEGWWNCVALLFSLVDILSFCCHFFFGWALQQNYFLSFSAIISSRRLFSCCVEQTQWRMIKKNR